MTKTDEICRRFMVFFDGSYGILPEYDNLPNTFEMGLTGLNYNEEKNELSVHLRRPGLLIGRAGETINKLEKFLDCKVRPVEALLWVN